MKKHLIALIALTALSSSFSSFASQEVNNSNGLQKTGTVSDSSGALTLSDLEKKLQNKAAEKGASAFRIISVGGNNTLYGVAEIYR
ncbi:DUF1471 domain-containing protein [Erwinia sp.]|uniref:DUF1471 domain-containing protein n=1 Tax=Erwinia citreus TaxID=558 RepID=UPI003C732C6E